MKGICRAALIWLAAVLICTSGLAEEAGVLRLPQGVVAIEAEAFLNNGSISQIVLPEGVASIGERAFAGSGLAAINLPSGVCEIGEGAFDGCGEIIVEAEPGSYAYEWCLAHGPDNVRIAGRAAIAEAVAEQTSAHSFRLSWAVDAGNAASLSYDVLLSESADGEFAPVEGVGEGAVEIGGLEQGATYFCRLRVSAVENLSGGETYEYVLNSGTISVTLHDADYEYRISDGESSVEGVSLWEDGESTELTIPSQLGGCPVTAIGRQAFTNNAAVTKVAIPDTVTAIGSTAFYGCGALTAVEMGGGVAEIGGYAFAECPALSQVALSGALVSIGERAFLNDAMLNEIDLPGALTGIGERAFYGTGVTGFALPDGLSEIGPQALGNGVETIVTGEAAVHFQAVDNVLYTAGLTELVCIPRSAVGSEYIAPDALEVVRDDAFAGCGELESVVLSENTRAIGESAFEDCAALVQLSNGQNLETIGDRAFSGCALLTDESFAGMTALQSVGGYAFNGCTSLSVMEFPEELDSLGPAAFYGCTGLTRVSLPDEMSLIGDAAFYGCTALAQADLPAAITDGEGFGVYLFYGCTALESAAIPDGVKAVGDYSFYQCTALSSVSLPEGLESIDFAAFFTCKALAGVEIPETVTTINAYAFANCAKLTEVQIPACTLGSYSFGACGALTCVRFMEGADVTIPAKAFYNCTKLAQAHLPANVTAIDPEAFAGCTAVVLYVEEGSHAHDFAVENGLAYELAG